MNTLCDKAIAIFRRDLLTAIRYRGAFVMGAAGAVMEIAGTYYLARAVGPAFRPDGMDAYSFLLVGAGFYSFLLMGISSFVTAIQEAQHGGALEVLMTTSAQPVLVMSLSAMSTFVGPGATFLLYLAAGLWIAPAHVKLSNVSGCLLVLLLSACIAIAIGIAAGAVQLALQKGSAVVWMLGSAAWLLTGAMFPVSALPSWLHWVAGMIPLTHALAAMRIALLTSAPFPGLVREIAILAAFATVLLPASLGLFSESLRRARLNGSLSFY